MFRLLLITALLIALALGYLWFSAQQLPGWYSAPEPFQKSAVEQLTEKIEQQGVAKFLGDKFADVMAGEVRLDEREFNALLLASLADHRDGRRLLAVSDAVNAELSSRGIEIGAVINVSKVRNADAKTRAALDQVLATLPFAAEKQLYLGVRATPVARGGGLALGDDLSVRIGSIPISSALLRRAGVPLTQVQKEVLLLRSLKVNSVAISDEEVVFGVVPKF